MVEGNKTRRYIAEKIALPVIFVISLLAAWLVVDVEVGHSTVGAYRAEPVGIVGFNAFGQRLAV